MSVRSRAALENTDSCDTLYVFEQELIEEVERVERVNAGLASSKATLEGELARFKEHMREAGKRVGDKTRTKGGNERETEIDLDTAQTTRNKQRAFSWCSSLLQTCPPQAIVILQYFFSSKNAPACLQLFLFV